MKEISITEIEGFCIGSTENTIARTGVTVILCPQGANAGVDISGGGPASRETPLLSDLTSPHPIHAVVFSGGSAFGLAACDGVMRFLEERDIGYQTKYAKVPLVVGSCLYDLNVGDGRIRPDGAMGYAACEAAMKNQPISGPVGAGCGATVGKICGVARSCPSGLGIYAAQIGDVKMGAIVAVNAVGDVFDSRTGEKLAGMKTPDGTGWSDSLQELLHAPAPQKLSNTNTTLGCIITNAAFERPDMNKIAAMTRCAYARCIRPVGTMADGDTIYAMSLGDVPANINMAGAFAAEVMAEAIRRAVTSV